MRDWGAAAARGRAMMLVAAAVAAGRRWSAKQWGRCVLERQAAASLDRFVAGHAHHPPATCERLITAFAAISFPSTPSFYPLTATDHPSCLPIHRHSSPRSAAPRPSCAQPIALFVHVRRDIASRVIPFPCLSQLPYDRFALFATSPPSSVANPSRVMPPPCGCNQCASSAASSPGSTSKDFPTASLVRNIANEGPFRRLLAGCIYTAAAVTWINLVLGPTIEIVDEEEAEEGDEDDWDEDEEYEDDGLFIPLGWTKPVPRSFYRGSDPEWQEFRKVASDSKRHEQIRRTCRSLSALEP